MSVLRQCYLRGHGKKTSTIHYFKWHFLLDIILVGQTFSVLVYDDRSLSCFDHR